MPDCSWCNIVGINNIRDGALALETAMGTHPARVVFCLLSVRHSRFQLERYRGIEESMPRYGKEAEMVLKTLAAEPQNLAQLAGSTGIPLQELTGILLALEIDGVIAENPPGVYMALS